MHNLLQILTDLKNKVSKIEGKIELRKTLVYGICDYVRHRTHNETALTKFNYTNKLIELFESWEHYSGTTSFPIQGDYTAYILHMYDAFNPAMPYCQLRLKLLDHCISELAKQNTITN